MGESYLWPVLGTWVSLAQPSSVFLIYDLSQKVEKYPHLVFTVWLGFVPMLRLGGQVGVDCTNGCRLQEQVSGWALRQS
jgi:hypothetical protein